MRSLLASLTAIAVSAWGAENAASKACAPCHDSIYRSFMRTPMAQSSGRTGTGEFVERLDAASYADSHGAFTYRAGRDNGAYYFEFRQQGVDSPVQGRRKLAYYVGSGSAARSYVIDVNGFLYEAPVAYYGRQSSWKAAPGFEDAAYPVLTRPILPGCLQCHASGIQHIAGTQNAYSSPPFLEGGVACERCHGPGSEHVEKGEPLVNPAKLAARERDSICEQCHLSGEIRVPKPGKDREPLLPGARLADYLTVFVRAGVSSQLKVTSHVENFAQSACKRASGDKMWCGSCHDPHALPAPAEKTAYFRNKCLTCHEMTACGAPQTARRANGDDCVRCHMPQNPTADVEHVVFTDHSIRRRPSPVKSPEASAALVPFGGGTASTRDLALAYAMVGLRDRHPSDLDRAFQTLKEAAAQVPADADVLMYLAQFYRDRKDDAHALPLYEQAWKLDRSQYAAAAALGAYEMQRGNYEEAAGFWKEALAINPSMVLVRENLATALLRIGKAEEARETLRKALEFNPTLPAASDLLDRIAK